MAPVTSRVVPSLFILASSVCKSLQCLISSLTQGVDGGHLFRLTCSVVLWGVRTPASKYHWRVWGCLQCMGRIGFAPAHCSECAFWVYTAQAPGCSAGVLSKLGLAFRALPVLSCSGSGSRVLHKGTDSAGHVFWGLPRSEQLRRPGGRCVSTTFLVLAAWFPGCAVKH